MFLNTYKDTNIKVSEDSEKTYPYTSIIKMINTKVNVTGLFPFKETIYEDLDDMHNHILEICNNNKTNFIYAYHDEQDHTMHIIGTNSKDTLQYFKTINNKTEELCKK